MPDQLRIQDLIEDGCHVLENDLDQTAFLSWRKRAFDCLTDLLGPDHTYTQCFRDYVRATDKTSLLTGKGILEAAKAQMTKSGDKFENAVFDRHRQAKQELNHV